MFFCCTSPFLLEPLDKAVHADVDGVWAAGAAAGSLAELHPPGRGEVGGLRAVEAGVEARVVAAGEGDHDLALVLHDLVVGDAVLPQDQGADQTHFVAEVGGTCLLQLGKQSIRESLEPPHVSCGY